MPTFSLWRRPATVAAGLPMIVSALTGPSAAATTPLTAPLASPATPVGLPTPLAAPLARVALAGLTVAEPRPMTGYSRAKFPHWSGQGEACDAREVVLARDGQDVQRDEQCRAVSGTWYSEYDGRTFTSASGIDIDHLVSLPVTA
ncbi:hypothetical protein ACQPYK_29075 [Streptosporangium sp. CA-135522]|uniref:hypothetical protein n=1 Tax=Streptosporangium sp. CA-135522 TaxID=3240072 RepID=UPI003D8F0C55